MNARPVCTLLVALVSLLSTRTAATAADAYTIDPAHTSVMFSVSHIGISYVYGMFRKAEGGYVLDRDNPANCQFSFTLQTASLDTNHAERDNHLRSPEFFSVQQYPTITFVSTSCQRANTPDGGIVYNVTGNLTMHGQVQRITIPLRMLGEGQGPFKDYRSGFLANFTIKRSDYGMTFALDNNMVGDAVSVTMSFEGIRREAAAAQARTQ